MADSSEDKSQLPRQDAPSGEMANRIKVVGFVAIVVLLECLGAYLFLPEPAATEAQIRAQLAGESSLDLQPEKLLDQQDDSHPKVEVELGSFSVTAFQPVSNTTLRIDFQLVGIVLADDESELTQLLADRKNRLSDQVIAIMRSAQLNDLTDANLGLIKRRVLEKSNRLLGKPLLQEVVFSEFSFVEQ